LVAVLTVTIGVDRTAAGADVATPAGWAAAMVGSTPFVLGFWAGRLQANIAITSAVIAIDKLLLMFITSFSFHVVLCPIVPRRPIPIMYQDTGAKLFEVQRSYFRIYPAT
jgi:hypothetical protein